MNRWKSRDVIASSDFIYREKIMAQRILLFELAGVETDAIVLGLVNECREESYFGLARYHLSTINNAENMSPEMKVSV